MLADDDKGHCTKSAPMLSSLNSFLSRVIVINKKIYDDGHALTLCPFKRWINHELTWWLRLQCHTLEVVVLGTNIFPYRWGQLQNRLRRVPLDYAPSTAWHHDPVLKRAKKKEFYYGICVWYMMMMDTIRANFWHKYLTI